MPTKAEWLAKGVPERFIVDRETHPLFYESNWPLSEQDERVLGKRAAYRFPHLKPMSVLVCIMGNMWKESCWHRLQDMVVHSDEQGRTVAVQEITDGCVLPFDNIAQMHNAAALMALDSGAEWLLYLETDVALEKDTLERLLAWDRPVIAPRLIDVQSGTALSYPEVPADDGLVPVTWAVFSCMLFNVRVFNALGNEPWGSGNGLSEYQFAQKLNHYGHRIYVDSNTSLDVVSSPGRTRAKTWDEYWADMRRTFENNRALERDRRPPPGFDPVFTNGKLAASGAYMPLGSAYGRRSMNGAAPH